MTTSPTKLLSKQWCYPLEEKLLCINNPMENAKPLELDFRSGCFRRLFTLTAGITSGLPRWEGTRFYPEVESVVYLLLQGNTGAGFEVSIAVTHKTTNQTSALASLFPREACANQTSWHALE